MAKIIIGIHGLNGKPEANLLWDGWKKSIQEGLRVNTQINNSSFSFEGVFWDDVMRSKRDPNPDLYKLAKPGTLKEYREGVLDTIRQEVQGAGGDLIDWFKKKLNANHLADAVLKVGLKDLSKYYEKQSVKAKLTGRLKATVKKHRGKNILIIAHSMGSIIAYDALRELGREDNSVRIEHLITIGSPLGLPHAKNKNLEFHNNLRTPTTVKRWTNLADKRDPVAFDEHLADDYETNVAGVNVVDNLVFNDWVVGEDNEGIHHKSYGYLRTPEFSRLIKEFV